MPRVNIDRIAEQLVLSDELNLKYEIFKKILGIAQRRGIYPYSIAGLYRARGKGECGGFTVPAINLRVLTYDLARAIFRVAKKFRAGAFIFEIARSEMGYTDQRPVEYAGVCLAAAIREGYAGPVFLQGDHFQVNHAKFNEDARKEIASLEKLIQEAMGVGFYNIDIDSSTLVDLSKDTVKTQQELNCRACAELVRYIRAKQPRGIEVSIGGEIGEVGGKNSTPEEFRAFMEGIKENVPAGMDTLSKISVQTGTSHGGVVLPDGSIAKVKLDFGVLDTIGEIARKEYGMAGTVQHGASTLPEELFHRFPQIGTAEIHLATQFQNMVYESKYFPAELRDKMYAWLQENCKGERKEGMSQEQFIYQARKKALGPFKRQIMGLEMSVRQDISCEVEDKIAFLFQQLKVSDTQVLIEKFVKPAQPVRVKVIKEGVSGPAEQSSEGAD